MAPGAQPAPGAGAAARADARGADLRLVPRRAAAAAEAIGAMPIRYPVPLGAGRHRRRAAGGGVRVGIIAREDAAEAWRVADERFPGRPRGPGRPRHGDARLATRTGTTSWPGPALPGPRRPRAPGTASRTPTGWGRSRTTRRSARTWSARTTASARASRATSTGARDVFVLDIPPAAEELGTPGAVFARARSGGPRMTRRLQDYARAVRRPRTPTRPRLVLRRRGPDLRRARRRGEPARARPARARAEARATGCACSRRRRRGRSPR